MRQIWYSYISPLFSPFKMAKAIGAMEQSDLDVFKWNGRSLRFLNLSESIACSWPFALIYALYSIINIRLGLAFVNHMQSSYDDSVLANFVSLELFAFKKWMIFSILFTALFFPLSSWVFVKFWKMITLFALNLFLQDELERGISERVERVVGLTLCSNVLLVVPVFGTLLKRIAFFFLFFGGLRHNLGLSRIQSFVVLLAPFLTFGAMLAFFGLTLGIYLNIV